MIKNDSIHEKRPHHLPPLKLPKKTAKLINQFKKLNKDPAPERATRILENFAKSTAMEAEKAARDQNLVRAISFGSLSEFINLAEELQDIDTPIQKEEAALSCLSYAILTGRYDICRYLIGIRGANIDKIESIEGLERPLTTYYASLGDTQSLQILVESFNADPNQKDALGRSPLSYLAERHIHETSSKKRQELEDAIHMLADYDANLEQKDRYGNTVLMQCVQEANLCLIQILASHFAVETQTQNRWGEDALTIALNNLQSDNPDEVAKYCEIVEYLAQVVDTDTLKTKLVDQVLKENEKACKLLLEIGKFSIDEIIDDVGNTLLLNSARLGKIEQVKMLLKLGANVHFTNHEGKNAFFYAQEKLKDFRRTGIDWLSISRFLAQYMAIHPL